MAIRQKRVMRTLMSADEVLRRLSMQARADVGAYVAVSDDGALVADIEAMKRDGVTQLIREMRQTANGIEIKLHDSQAALVQLGKHYGLFSDRVDVDWRQVLEREGVDPDVAFAEISAQLETLLRAGTVPHVVRGVGAGTRGG